jgi:putative hydrolase of the HAD superfamily
VREPRLVLDVHGVVLNNPLPDFLEALARRTGERPQDLRRRWHEEIRKDAWLGRIPDEELWKRLAGDRAPEGGWLRDLEGRYAPGPAAPHLRRWGRRASIWLLSNHRSPWLLPRLARLDLHGAFDEVLVSDEVGALKPERAAFRAALAGLDDPSAALFVDDQVPNIEAAADVGLAAVHAAPGTTAWVGAVDGWLGDGRG